MVHFLCLAEIVTLPEKVFRWHNSYYVIIPVSYMTFPMSNYTPPPKNNKTMDIFLCIP